jgi:hypothetical protein
MLFLMPVFQCDPVFFNQFGQMITREEAGFADGDDDDDDFDYTYPEEFQDTLSSQEEQFNPPYI